MARTIVLSDTRLLGVRPPVEPVPPRKRYGKSSRALQDTLEGIYYDLATLIGTEDLDGEPLFIGHITKQSGIITEVGDTLFAVDGDPNEFAVGVYGLEGEVIGAFVIPEVTGEVISSILTTLVNQ